jgi:hypothetical protein
MPGSSHALEAKGNDRQQTEQPMTSRNEDLNDVTEGGDELDQHGLALHQLIQDYMDEHELSDELTALLLLNISIRMRMIGYALETEDPSPAGLKQDLDQFQREAGDCIQAAKKGADEFIEEAMVLREAAEEEIDDEMDEPGIGRKDRKGIPS